jgi:TonB family protein
MTTPVRWGAKIFLRLAAITIAFSTISQSQESAEQSRKVVTQTAAVYPTLARSMNIHGIVKLEVVVAPNGSVKKVDVKGGHPLLTQSAVTAVGHWKFEPAPHDTKELVEVKFAPE